MSSVQFGIILHLSVVIIRKCREIIKNHLKFELSKQMLVKSAFTHPLLKSKIVGMYNRIGIL